MTQFVADQTPILGKTWRRHTDPPSLWIAVALGSITLHLLLFWLMRSYGSSLLLKQSSSNFVPIEFIEISSPRGQAKTKPVASKSSSTPRRSAIAKESQRVTQQNSTAKPASVVEDKNAIAFTSTADVTQKPLKPQIAEQKKTQLQPKFTLETDEPITSEKSPEPKPSPDIVEEQPLEPTPSPTIVEEQPLEPTPSPDIAKNTDTQNPDNQESSQQNQAFNPHGNISDLTNTDSSDNLPSQTPEQPLIQETDLPNIPKPEGEVIVGKGTPLEDLAPSVKPEQSPPTDESKNGGIGIATWSSETDLIRNDRTDTPPQPIGGSSEKELNFLSLNKELDNQPIEFLASLLIDSEGNLKDIIVDPKIAEPRASQYKEYAEELFKGQKFTPANHENGTKPPLGQLPVRIRIQRKSPVQ